MPKVLDKSIALFPKKGRPSFVILLKNGNEVDKCGQLECAKRKVIDLRNNGYACDVYKLNNHGYTFCY